MIYFILPMGDRAFADELSTKIRVARILVSIPRMV